MATQDYLSEIQSYTAPAREQATAAGVKVAETLKGGATLPFKLKEALNEKLNYNKDLIEQRSGAMADYFSAPSEARAKYEDVWNPFQREALTQRYTAQQLAPFQTLTSLLDQRMGSVADVVGQGVAGWQGVTQAAQQMSNLAQTQYQSAFNEYAKAAELQKAAEQMALQERQMMLPYEQLTKYQQEQLDLDKQRLAQSGSGGGSGGGLFGDLGLNDVLKLSEFFGKEPPEKAADLRSLVGAIDKTLGDLGDSGGFGGTGPLAQFFPQWAAGGDVRTAIDSLATDIRKEKFGTAITESEAKSAGWLPGKGKVEESNRVALETMRDSKMRELRNQLKDAGYSNEQIDSYVQSGTTQTPVDIFNQLLSSTSGYMFSYAQ